MIEAKKVKKKNFDLRTRKFHFLKCKKNIFGKM